MNLIFSPSLLPPHHRVVSPYHHLLLLIVLPQYFPFYVSSLLDWDGHIKLTDLGLCKKVEIETAYRDMTGDSISVHSAEAVLNEANASLGLSPDGMCPVSPGGGGAGAAACLTGESGPQSTSPRVRPTHRERVLAYSTVGTPDYIAPEVWTHRHSFVTCSLVWL